MNNITQTIKTLTLAAILFLGISFAYAWTEPTSAPTGGSTSAPINTSDIAQAKPGNIGVNAMAISNTAAGALQVAGGASFGGNVGIGTTAPTYKFEVYGDGARSKFTNTNTVNMSNVMVLQNNSSTGYSSIDFNNSSGSQMGFMGYGNVSATNYGDKIYLGSANKNIIINPGTANVGIGTGSPSNKLTVSSATSLDGIHVTDGTRWTKIMPGTVGAGSYNGIVQANDSAIIYSNGTQGTGNFVIAPWASGTSGLRMDSTGNVGIGTTSMGEKLVVNKGADDWVARFSGASGYLKLGWGAIQSYTNANTARDLYINPEGGNVGIGTSAPDAKLHVVGSIKGIAASGTQSLFGTSDYNAYLYITPVATTDTNGYVALGAYDWSTPGQRGARALALNSSGGNVGIGTTDPGQKLSVAGTVESTSGGFKFPDGSTQSTASVSRVSVITASTNPWTKLSDTKKIMVEVVGGGGGGGAGGYDGSFTTDESGGGGGGGGGYIRSVIDVSGVSSFSVTIGSGGAGGSKTQTTSVCNAFTYYIMSAGAGGNGSDTSFTAGSTIIKATGGKGGNSSGYTSISGSCVTSGGGSGGGSGGSFSASSYLNGLSGNSGSNGDSGGSSGGGGGDGGNTAFGFGNGGSGGGSNGGGGSGGSNYGSGGGGGGSDNDTSGGGGNGGAGAKGVVIITEYAS